MTRKELKKIAKELIDCNEDYEITQEYSHALSFLDLKKLEYFKSMGGTVRHQIMNVNDYRHRLQYGFTEIKFTESGWLENVEWLNYEKIEIKVSGKGFSQNEIRLAMGLNGKWVYSLSYGYNNGGGGWYPSVFNKPLSSREEAYQAGIKDLAERHKDKDCEISKKVIKWIEANVKKEPEGQLQLF
jgi:hypothetical protein